MALPNQRLLVDGHVHLHDRFDCRRAVDAALRNLGRHGAGLPTLLLTEMAGHDAFTRWRDGDAPGDVTRTDEPESIYLDERLLVVAGRQIATRERIEVLALATSTGFRDGMPLDETLAAVSAAGAIPVLPWGVGKWTGARGRRVAEACRRPGVLLGDNGGRPLGWSAPGLFANRIVLPGTDPLDLPGEEDRIGSYAFALDLPFDRRRPAAFLRKALAGLERSPEPLGRRVGLAAFVRLQLGLRLRRRARPVTR